MEHAVTIDGITYGLPAPVIASLYGEVLEVRATGKGKVIRLDSEEGTSIVFLGPTSSVSIRTSREVADGTGLPTIAEELAE